MAGGRGGELEDEQQKLQRHHRRPWIRHSSRCWLGHTGIRLASTRNVLPFGSPAETQLSLLQLDIEAEFVIDEAALMATTEADVGYNCSTSGGAAARGMLGPFGLLVLADKALSEQTAVYFYVARGRDGRLRAHFCQDESRHVLLTSVVPFASITCSYRDI